jgi:hypothetical protein
VRLAELTRVSVRFDPNRQPHHVVVRLDDPTLFRCWEREGESAEYFNLFSPRGYAIGVNVVLYAFTH